MNLKIELNHYWNTFWLLRLSRTCYNDQSEKSTQCIFFHWCEVLTWRFQLKNQTVTGEKSSNFGRSQNNSTFLFFFGRAKFQGTIETIDVTIDFSPKVWSFRVIPSRIKPNLSLSKNTEPIIEMNQIIKTLKFLGLTGFWYKEQTLQSLNRMARH